MKCSAGVPRFHMVQAIPGGQRGGGGGWEGPMYLTIQLTINTHNMYTMMKKFCNGLSGKYTHFP